MPTFTRRVADLVADPDFNFGLTPEDYPIFDETYREGLNTKIINHYMNYEIGQETESMFRFALNRKMNEVMPYYNQLYLSTRLEFDPMLTVKYTESGLITNDLAGTVDNTTHGTSTTESDSTSKSRTVNSDTPQVPLSPDEDYASGAVNNNSSANATGSGTNDGTNNTNTTNTGTVDTDRTVEGFQGIPSTELLMRYRATFLNIDMQVIDELKTLFMQLWDNGDEYSGSNGGILGVYPFGYNGTL